MRVFKRLIEKIPAQTRENIKEGFRHPIIWLRGEGLPKEVITPWELLLFLFHRMFGTMAGGFNRHDFLYKDVYRVPSNMMSIAGIISSLFDAANDPLLGAYMDRKRMGVQTFRTIMRISAFTGHTLNMLKMLDGGLNPWQHIAVLVVCNCLQDIIGTMDGVASTKLRAGMSPLTQQRGRAAVWGNMGYQLGWPIGNLPTTFMGLRSIFKFSDYQIIVLGSLIFLPLNILASILPSFVRQRVHFTAEKPSPEIAAALEESDGAAQDLAVLPEEPKIPLTKSFTVLKYNPYFIANAVAGFITVWTPTAGEEILLYRWLIPTRKIFGTEVTGEALLMIKQMLAGTLSNVLKPFSRQIINRIGGPLNAQKLNSLCQIVCNAIKFAGGLRTIPGFVITVVTEMIIYGIQDLDSVAKDMLSYEFYDKVELETGMRTEGVTAAVDGFFNKIVTNNIGLVTGNAFLQWTGYRGDSSNPNTKPPARYLKWMWPMATLAPVVDNIVYLVARSFVKWTPEDRERTEAGLAARRSETQALAGEVAGEGPTGGGTTE